MKNFIYKWRPLIIILLIAAALRITSLLTRGNFWFDENFSIHFSTLPFWADTWKYWVLETNPPLYTFFLRLYLPFINPDNEILARLPSLIFGLMTVALLYIFAEKILSKKAAIISSIMLAFSVLHIFASAETRVYSLLALLTTASFFIFYKIVLEQKESKKLWVIYTLLNILLLYSHLTSLAVVLAQFLILQFSATKKEISKTWFICQFISFTLWFVWFMPSIISKLNLDSGNAWFFENSGNIIILLLYPLINSLDNNLLNTLFTLLLFAGFYIFINMVKEAKYVLKRNTLLFIATWALLPIILSSMVSSFTIKYIMISYPAFFMLTASIIEKYITGKKSFFVFIMFMAIVFAPPTIKFISEPLFSWNILNDYLAKKDNGHSIVLIPFIQEISFKKYYNGEIPLVSLYFKQDNFSLEERVVKYNWQIQNTTKEEIYKFILLNIKKNGADKIFLLDQRNKFKMVENVLLENHWSLIERSPTVGSDNYIIEFNAPNYQTTPAIGLPANR